MTKHTAGSKGPATLTKAATARLQKARAAGTLKLLAGARACIDGIQAAPGQQLHELTRHAAKQVANLAEQHLVRIESLPAHTAETWCAAANLLRAAELAEAVLASPEAWGGMGMVAEALQVLGNVNAQSVLSARLTAQRSKPRPNRAGTAKLRILEVAAASQKASGEAIRRELEKEGVSVSDRWARRVKASKSKP